MVDRRRFVASCGLAMFATDWSLRAALGAPSKPASQDGFGGFGPESDEWILARMRAAHVPGISFAVVQEGEVARTAALGLADLRQRRPMRADTLLNIASVTKTITCTAIMQLWQQRAFALEDDVNRYLPFTVRNPRYSDAPITFRQLLTHTSSIGDGPAYGRSYGCGDPSTSLRDWLHGYFTAGGASYDAARNFHSWEPGAKYKYSNVGYGLLGLLIERLAGMPYEDYVCHRVFKPLGMSQSRFWLAGMERSAHATPYTYQDRGRLSEVALAEPGWRAPVGATPDGLLVPHCLYSFATPPDGLTRTSASELVRLLLAYLKGGAFEGGRVLEAGTVREILSKQPLGRNEEARVQGLAWYGQKHLGPGLIWGHSGGDPGVVTLMALRSQDQSGLVALTNSSGGLPVIADLARKVFGG